MFPFQVPGLFLLKISVKYNARNQTNIRTEFPDGKRKKNILEISASENPWI